MKTLVDIDDNLINYLKKNSGIKSKKEIINRALIEYSKELKRNKLIDAFGKFTTDFDVLAYRELELKDE